MWEQILSSLQNNPVLWFLGVIIAAFVAGFAARDKIMSVGSAGSPRGASTVGSEVPPVPESHEEGSIIEFANYGRAVEKIKELLKSPKDGRHSLKFLAVTGRGLLANYLSELIKDFKGPLDIELQVIDPDGPYIDLMPNHWKTEVESTIQEITGIYNARPKDSGTLKVFKYEYLPCMNGDIFNEDHLILCLFGWDHKTGKLGDFKEHYFYYKRNSKTKKDFELFQSWFDHAPKSPWETNAKKS